MQKWNPTSFLHFLTPNTGGFDLVFKIFFLQTRQLGTKLASLNEFTEFTSEFTEFTLKTSLFPS